MTGTESACDLVAARYDQKRQNGLVDVKFLFQSRDEVSLTEACEELLAINEAVEAGNAAELDFGDLNWRDVAFQA